MLAWRKTLTPAHVIEQSDPAEAGDNNAVTLMLTEIVGVC